MTIELRCRHEDKLLSLALLFTNDEGFLQLIFVPSDMISEY